MRIIAGTLRGRVLLSPTGRDVRPTAARAREAIFNMLHTHAPLADKVVFDLFCGTGALGLEALSRGAAHVTFVDLNPYYAQENVSKFGVADQCTVIKANALRYKPIEKADAIFIDPPYHFGLTEKALQMHETLGKTGTLWIVETESKYTGTPYLEVGPFEHIASRTYGAGTITLLRQT